MFGTKIQERFFIAEFTGRGFCKPFKFSVIFRKENDGVVLSVPKRDFERLFWEWIRMIILSVHNFAFDLLIGL